MRLRPQGVLAALPLALALTLTGCGGDDGGTGVASAADGAGGGGAPEAEQSLSPDEKAMKFAECMRENGVPMEDPDTSGKGVKMKVGGKDVDPAVMKKAQEACRKYSPMQDAGPPSAEEHERALEHAECMRENGVEEFPDPDPNRGGITISGKIAPDPDFDPAQKQCAEIMEGGGK